MTLQRLTRIQTPYTTQEGRKEQSINGKEGKIKRQRKNKRKKGIENQTERWTERKNGPNKRKKVKMKNMQD